MILVSLIIIFISHTINRWKFGLSPDSCGYIRCGTNLAQGKGLILDKWNINTGEIEQSPRLQQPPLYSISIAILHKIGFKPVTAAFTLSYASMFLSVLLVYIIARLISSTSCALWCGFISATTVAFVNKGFWAWTEPGYSLLMLLSILFYLLGEQAVRRRSRLIFPLLCAAMLVFGFYCRYIGLFSMLPFGIGYFRSALTDRQSRPILLLFILVVVIGIAPMLIINYMATDSISGAQRIPASSAFWQTLSSAVGGLIVVFCGGYSGWRNIVPLDFLQAKVAIAFIVVLTGLYTWLLYRKKKYHIILGYTIITFISLVALRSRNVFDALDSHGCRLLSPLFPVIAIMTGWLIHRMVSGCFGKQPKLITYTVIVLVVAAQLVVQAGYAQGQGADYAVYGMQKATHTLNWIEGNIPKKSKVLINYQAMQVASFAGGYYTYLLPSASAKQKPWDRQDYQQHLKNNEASLWLVFIWHPHKSKRHEASQYGAYIYDLLVKGRNQEFMIVSQFPDGMIYKSRRQ